MEGTEKEGVSEMFLTLALWLDPAVRIEHRRALPWAAGPAGWPSKRKGRWAQTVLAPSQGWCSQLAAGCAFICVRGRHGY